jgi:translation initiation factor 2A
MKITPENSLLSGVQLKTSPILSSNGTFVAYLPPTEQSIIIHHTETGEVVSRIPCADVENVEFSPMGTFITTWSRPTRSVATNEARENFKVWHLPTASLIGSFHQRTYRKGLLQWMENESTCLRLVTNEVHQLAVTTLPPAGEISSEASPAPSMSLIRVAKLHHPNVTQFSVSPKASEPSYVALFTPEHSGKTARVSLYRFNSQLVANEPNPPLAESFVNTSVSRSLFRSFPPPFLPSPSSLLLQPLP